MDGRLPWLATLTGVLLATPAAAEIEKFAIPNSAGYRVYWWPRLPPLAGWTHDEPASRAHRINAYVPVGASFGEAPAVLYARALYKAHIPETRTLAELIRADRTSTLRQAPGTQVTPQPALRDGDGHPLTLVAYTPLSEGSHDLVAFGEEGEFFLVFSLSARSAEDLAAARPDFEALLAAYRVRLPATPVVADPTPADAQPAPAATREPAAAPDPTATQDVP